MVWAMNMPGDGATCRSSSLLTVFADRPYAFLARMYFHKIASTGNILFTRGSYFDPTDGRFAGKNEASDYSD